MSNQKAIVELYLQNQFRTGDLTIHQDKQHTIDERMQHHLTLLTKKFICTIHVILLLRLSRRRGFKASLPRHPDRDK
jgi:hypothetical protein